VLCCPYCVAPEPPVGLHKSLGLGQTQPASWDRGACRQLPPGSSDYHCSVVLPLSNRAERSYNKNFTSSQQQKLSKQSCFFVRKSCNYLNWVKGENLCYRQGLQYSYVVWSQGQGSSIWRGVRSPVLFFFSFSISSNKKHLRWYLAEFRCLSFRNHNEPVLFSAKHMPSAKMIMSCAWRFDKHLVSRKRTKRVCSSTRRDLLVLITTHEYFLRHHVFSPFFHLRTGLREAWRSWGTCWCKITPQSSNISFAFTPISLALFFVYDTVSTLSSKLVVKSGTRKNSFGTV